MKICTLFVIAAFFMSGCADPLGDIRAITFNEPDAPVYTVKIDTVTGGIGTIEPKKDSYEAGEQIKITATPNSGYSFSGWTGTLDIKTDVHVFTILKNEWLIPVFTKDADPPAKIIYTLTTEWNPIGGTITSSTGTKINFLPGEKCFIIAFPKDGYQFGGWEGDIKTAGDSVYITFDKDYQVYPRFTKIPEVITYTLNAVATHGTIQCTPQKSVYYANEIVRIAAQPDSGYMFSHWDGEYTGNEAVFDLVMDGNKIISIDFIQREWTFVVYMAADNDLEAAALADFNELEAVSFSRKPVSVLVLLDRSPGYDATNGDWTDTRLYEITTDANGNNAVIQSKRLDCPVLDLTATSATELDMSNPLVLSRLIDFAKNQYTASRYGLIVWGHGTGWRNGGVILGDMPEPIKAVAIDDTTGNYMSLSKFGSAIQNKGLSVIGFDTCFSALLEVAYQLKDVRDSSSNGTYMVGSAGVIPANGWDYQAVFTNFLSKSDMTAANFSQSVVTKFKEQYSGTPNTSISRIKLSEVERLFNAFENFTGILAENITTVQSKNIVLDTILNSVDSYYFNPPSDLYIDLYDFAEKIKSVSNTITTNSSAVAIINAAAEALKAAVNSTITDSWAQNSAKNQEQIGVHVIGITAQGVPATSHSLDYVRGSISMNKSAFVENSIHWVPNNTPSPASLLDKLFYLQY